jgi:N-acyl-D-amino-acid deacylase
MKRSLLLLAAAIGSAAAAQPQVFDVLIRGGRVLDGSGNPSVYADVGIRGDSIAAVGNLRPGACWRASGPGAALVSE